MEVHLSQACLLDNQYTQFYYLQTPTASLCNVWGNTCLSLRLLDHPDITPLPSLCCGSPYTSGECVSKLFLVTTSAWRSVKRKKLQPAWVRGKMRRNNWREEGYIAFRVSLRWFRPVPAPLLYSTLRVLLFLTSSLLSLSHCLLSFLFLSYFGRLSTSFPACLHFSTFLYNSPLPFFPLIFPFSWCLARQFSHYPKRDHVQLQYIKCTFVLINVYKKVKWYE